MATKDVFDTVPKGLMRSNRRGRLKPTPNPVMSNLKAQNADLKERLAALEDIVNGLANKKAKKA